MTKIALKFKEAVLQSTPILMCGQNQLAYDLFKVFVKQTKHSLPLIVLTTTGGRVLSFLHNGVEDETLSGRFIIPEERKKICPELTEFKCSEEFLLLSEPDNPAAAEIQSLMSGALACIAANEQQNAKILKSLDVVGNAISVYDEEARVLFANRRFYDDFHIRVKEKPIGMKITDITEEFGLNFRSFEKTSSGRFKMFDVLAEGKEALDWEIRLEFTKSGEPSRLVSNDMYPIKDENGRVKGLVEITRSRQQDVKTARKIVGLSADYTFDDIIGSSRKMQQQIHVAKEYAKSSFSVLITGESGVGKELFAQSIHNYSPRRKGPFIAINCANFPENLIESELFGYVAGAFTGASKNGNIGKFELANHGTLFLDEIGELPYHFQSKLLRVLETMTVTRIGSNQSLPVDVRIVAATNRDLRQMVKDGFFRDDLYFRLGVLNVDIPPLRNRKEDLFLLAEALLEQGKDPASPGAKKLSEASKKVLEAHDWPGNVRELRNVLNRASILSGSDTISEETLRRCIDPSQLALEPIMEDVPEGAENTAELFYKVYQEYLNSIVQEIGDDDDTRLSKRIHETQQTLMEILIRKTLEHTEGNKKRAAELLMISRKTLYNILNRESWDV